MKKIFLLALLLYPFFCIAQKYDTSPIITSGVLMINNDSLDYLSRMSNIDLPVNIMTIDNQIIDSIYYSNDNSPRFFGPIESRNYYPDHNVIVFDSYPIENGKYKVFYNNSWGYINHVEGITEYLTWEQFILRIFSFDTTSDNPLHVKRSINSEKLKYNYDNVLLSPMMVKGDWVFVAVYKIEHKGPIGHGWLRWRDGNKLLIKTMYFSL